MTTHQAAAILGLSERQVQHLAAQGRIPGAKKMDAPRGPVWVFKRDLMILPPERPAHRPKSLTARPPRSGSPR